jgi:predicted AAA+ superfamily ATPase
MKTEAALKVVAEWLEEREMPDTVRRRTPPVDLTRSSQILAIAGPRRAGKTFLMFQFIKGLLDSGVCKEEILSVAGLEMAAGGLRACVLEP